MAPIPVLVTRPEPGAGATAGRLREMGFAPVLAPLLTIEAMPPPPWPEDAAAIVVASRHALPPLPPGLHHLPLFAVGDATAEAARRQGFADIHSADGDAEALAALVAGSRRADDRPLLLAAGQGQGHRLAALLQRAGFRVERREVYAARTAVALPGPARALIAGREGGWVLLFSRETALCLSRLAMAAGLGAEFRTLNLAAISQTVADAAGGLPWRGIRVAMAPTETAVLALLND